MLEIERIALVVSYLPPRSQASHIGVLASFIRMAATAFPSVRILVLVANESERLRADGHEKLLEQKANHAIYQADVEQALRDRLSGGAEAIVTLSVTPGGGDELTPNIAALDAFAPSVVVYWGGAYEAKRLRAVAFNRFPTAFAFFSMTNEVDKSVDVYLTRVPGQPLKGPFDERKIACQPLAVHVPESNHVYDRREVKKRDDEITIVTALNGERIYETLKTYSEARMDRFFSTLRRYPQVRWLFIGPTNRKQIMEHDPRFRRFRHLGRFEVMKREPHLRAFFSHCDIFAHLPGLVGGGGGACMARAEGLAAICYHGSDACFSQWPGAVYLTDEAYFAALHRLIEDKAARAELGRTVRDYMQDNFTVPLVAARLKENFARVIAGFSARKTGTER